MCEQLGEYEVDEFSRVEVTVPADVCDLLTKMTAKLPSITSTSHLHDLVNVTGVGCNIVSYIVVMIDYVNVNVKNIYRQHRNVESSNRRHRRQKKCQTESYAAANSSVFRCALKVMMVVERLVDKTESSRQSVQRYGKPWIES